MSQPPVWLITGASSGLGCALARHVIQQDHKVIATSRYPSNNPELVSEFESQGAKWLALDTNWSEAELEAAVNKAESIFGRIDVLVNNAGVLLQGSTEDVPLTAVISQMQTNFLGPLSITRAVLPGMRKRASGVIMNVSSSQGLSPSPGNGTYAASKAALEAVTDSLKQEVAPFGIRVLVVLPGSYRTPFGVAGTYFGPSEPYSGDHIVGKRIEWVKKLGSGAAVGDPAKAAQVMFEAATGQGDISSMIEKEAPLRLFIGSDCWKRAEEKAAILRKTIDAQKDIAASTDA